MAKKRLRGEAVRTPFGAMTSIALQMVGVSNSLSDSIRSDSGIAESTEG